MPFQIPSRLVQQAQRRKPLPPYRGISGLQTQTGREGCWDRYMQAGQGIRRVQHKVGPYPIISRCTSTQQVQPEQRAHKFTLLNILVDEETSLFFSFSSTSCLTVGIFYQIRNLPLKSIFHLSALSYSGTLAALSSSTWVSPHPFPWAWGFRPKQLIFSVPFSNPSQHILHGLTNSFTVPYPFSYRCELQVYPCKYA